MSAISTYRESIALADLPHGKLRPSLRMTEDEFLNWCREDTRAEWIDGEVSIMAAENLIHVEQKYWLVWILKNFVEERKLGGRVIGAEFFVRLEKRLRTPDIFYIRADRESLIGPTRLDGSPDLAIEIVSPDSQSRDRREKYLEYEKAGVREYWIIDPLSQTVEAYTLGTSQTYTLIPETDGKIPSAVLPGFYLQPAWLWQEKLPDAIEILRGMGIAF